MEDSDKSIASGETLEAQFEAVKQLTNKSHVLQFGTQSWTGEPTSNFQGRTDTAPAARLVGKPVVPVGAAPARVDSDLPSADAELASAYARFTKTGSAAAGEELIRGVRERMEAARRFERIATAVTGAPLTGARHPEHADVECHYTAHKAYIKACGEWTSGALKHSADLAALCAATRGDARAIVAAIQETCSV